MTQYLTVTSTPQAITTGTNRAYFQVKTTGGVVFWSSSDTAPTANSACYSERDSIEINPPFKVWAWCAEGKTVKIALDTFNV